MKELSLPINELSSLANRIRDEEVGQRFELCSIMNAKSGWCNEDCKFCAQSSHYPTSIKRYPLKGRDEIVSASSRAKEIGAERFGIVTSGRSLMRSEIYEIAAAIQEIREKVGIKVCASLGMIGKDELRILKDAGLSRYHHNIETSPEYFPRVITTHRFKERVKTIRMAKDVGLEVCSGGIIGMGEDWGDRLRMAHILKELGVDSIPINILVPIKGTPFEGRKPLSPIDAIRTISIFRIILRDKTIKVAAGRESILKDFQGMAFLSGANGMLIGGYLTIKGRDVEEDHILVKEIMKAWGM